MKLVEVALFPGYVFCDFDIHKKLPIISCPGVEYIVGVSGIPTPISELEISYIQRMVEAGASAAQLLVRGQRVRVTHGPLEGVEGTLVRDQERDLLVVSIDLLNRSACLHIDQSKTCVVERAF
jgi:transcription antitermination factor NusG